jgi:hypothetical protein
MHGTMNLKKIWKLIINNNLINEYSEYEPLYYFKLHLLDLPGLIIH